MLTAEQKDMKSLKNALLTARSVVVLAGAGLSSASGLGTFRGPGGLWRTFDAVGLATPEAFQANPSRVCEFYEYRRQKALAATPNAAHEVLAKLSFASHRAKLLPACTSFTHITQNVDSLSVRAKDAVSTSSFGEPADTPLIEMHGSIVKPYCSRCKTPLAAERGKDPTPLAEGLRGIVERYESGEKEVLLPKDELPKCEVERCGGIVRPGVVWFGEMPFQLGECDAALRKADLLLVVGTSGVVYPAAGFAETVQDNGGKVAIFNIEEDRSAEADWVVLGPCEVTLPALFSS